MNGTCMQIPRAGDEKSRKILRDWKLVSTCGPWDRDGCQEGGDLSTAHLFEVRGFSWQTGTLPQFIICIPRHLSRRDDDIDRRSAGR